VYNAGMKKLALTLLITLSSLTTFSEEHIVKMLNAGKKA
jgi:hypothetical protein